MKLPKPQPTGKLELWHLPYLQDEITELFLSDPKQGERLSADARRCGMAARPMTLDTFKQIAPSLRVDPDLYCFHVEVSDVPTLHGSYSGGMMLIFRDDALTEAVADRLGITGQIPVTREDVCLTVN